MNIITSLLSNLNYGTIFFLMLLESTVIPVPSELVVSPAAYHAAAGNLDIFLVSSSPPLVPTWVRQSTILQATISVVLSSIVLLIANGAKCAC